jgi:pimeloyl-ACP methyl ester carboxylesterase
MPESHFVILEECGHFSYLECPDEVHKEITGFFEDG